jgi:hypothetical protein
LGPEHSEALAISLLARRRQGDTCPSIASHELLRRGTPCITLFIELLRRA